MRNERAGFLLGVIGGILYLLSAVLTLLGGTVLALLGHGGPYGLLNAAGGFVVQAAIGILALVFASVAVRSGRESGLAGGVVLVLLALVTWLVVGRSVLLILGGLLVLIGGVLLILERR